MAELGQQTLEMNLRKFLKAGENGASAAQDSTGTLEQVFEQILGELTTHCMEDPSHVSRAARLIEVAEILEAFSINAVYVGRLIARSARVGTVLREQGQSV